EPGMRECVAVVIMPSFVPHVTLDVRSNFFELVDPDDTGASMEDTVYWSRQIRTMKDSVQRCFAEANNYRPGEVERLMARVDQLSKRLPLQTMHAQVPYENTLGGFEMFSSGISDLSPELLDFYGEPGIDPARETVLYLVGNNFSVHETRVLAGNRVCDFRLLS